MKHEQLGKAKRGRQWVQGKSLPLLPLSLNAFDDKISTSSRVYQILRHAILSDVLAPGSWLRQDEVALQLTVSQTPVREALKILSRERLVELIPNYGARVSELSIDEFEEIYAVRKGIEKLAILRSVKLLSFEKIEELRVKYDKLAMLADRENLVKYLSEEWKFRMSMYRLGSSERFIEEIQTYREKAERYLRYAYTYDNSIGVSYGLHSELLSACESGDALLASRIVEKALNWTLETAGPVLSTILTSR